MPSSTPAAFKLIILSRFFPTEFLTALRALTLVMISALFCSKVLMFCKIPETSPFSSVSFSCTLMVFNLAELESSFILAVSKFSLINSTVFFSTMLLSLFLFSMSSSTLLLRKFTVLLRL